ncbi:MAG: hypothetical protein RIF41_29515 [Polyangiaceae bacterium]
MSPSTTSPLHAMPVLDVPFPRTVAASPARGDASGPQRPAAAYPSNKKTIIGVAPADDHDTPANRPTLPDAPASLFPAGVRPGRTIVGVGPSTPRDVIDDTPEIVAVPVRIDPAPVVPEQEPAPSWELPEEPAAAFQPSPFARDPSLGAADSIRLPRRRIEPGDWLLLALIVALVGVVLTLLF